MLNNSFESVEVQPPVGADLAYADFNLVDFNLVDFQFNSIAIRAFQVRNVKSWVVERFLMINQGELLDF